VRFLLPVPLLLNLAMAQDFAREAIEMVPGLTRDQRNALYGVHARQEQIDRRLKENPPKEEADRLSAERQGGMGGLDAAQWKRLVSIPRGPLREERYGHMVVLEVAPALERIVAAADAAQAAVAVQRERLLQGLEDQVMRARIEASCGGQIRMIESQFWRVAWYMLTPDQMRAARELFSPRYRQYADLPQLLQTLPGLTPSQSVKLRSLFAETESENAADLAEVRRIGAELRDPAIPQEKRQELNRANGAAYGRMNERNEAQVEAIRGVLTKEQLDTLHGRPPWLNPGEIAQLPTDLVREMRLLPEQTARLKQIEEGSAKARNTMRPPDMGSMMAEIGAESPQMMAVEVARQGARGQITDHFREVGRAVFVEVLTPAQVCEWIVTPWVHQK